MKMAAENTLIAILLEELTDDSITTQIIANNAFLQQSTHLFISAGLQSCNQKRKQLVLKDTKLCEALAPSLTKERVLTVEKKVLSTLWMLGNKECYRSVADRFGLSKGTLHHTVLGVCHGLASDRMMTDLIRFPSTRHEQEVVVEGFRQRCGFHGVVGAIDGTHIPIPAPKSEHRASYINRHGTSSMVLQVVVDHQLRIRDVCTGWPGSVDDARVYRNSPVAGLVEGLPDELHLLGDSAYPLSQHMMVPFRDDGHLDSIKKRCQASTRVEVERAIGLLKCKFRRLKYIDMLLEREMPGVVSSCCVLHNFILDHEGIDEAEDLPMNDQLCVNVVEGGEERRINSRALGEEKRRQISLSI